MDLLRVYVEPKGYWCAVMGVSYLNFETILRWIDNEEVLEYN